MTFLALVLALASSALPWQLDAATLVAGHPAEMSVQHVDGVAAPHAGHASSGDGMASHAPTGEPQRRTHEHGAECFWCVAVVGALSPTAYVRAADVAAPVERPVIAVVVVGRPVLHDAAPRAPPAKLAAEA